MSKIIYSVLFLGFCLTGLAQTFSIGQRSETFIDASRNNRQIASDVFYPASSQGINAPMAASNVGFPVLVFGHGFVMTVDAYQNFVDALVPLGYVVVLPKTEGSFSPSHQQFGLDLAFAVQAMQQLNIQSNSFYFGKLNSKSVLMGHSMGGGAATLAASTGLTQVFLVTFAPAETNPSAVSAAAQVQVPSLVFAGQNDCVTPPQTHQLPIFNALSSTCKHYISLVGGSHCQMANSNFFCNIGESSCSPSPSISREVQHQRIFELLIPWLRFHLFEDCLAGAQFDDLAQTNHLWEVQSSCELCALSSPHFDRGFDFEFYPNPSKGELVLFPKHNQNVFVSIFDITGRMQLEMAISQKTVVQLPIAKGMYTLQVVDGAQQRSYKLLRN